MPKDEIDINEVKTAIVDVQTAFSEFKNTLDVQMKEQMQKHFDPLLDEKLGKIEEEMGKKQEAIDKLYAQNRRKNVFLDGKPVDMDELDAKALDWAQLNAKRQGTQINEYNNENMDEYKSAFNRYLRKDDRVITADEQKALSVGSDPDGGYMVHPDMAGRVVSRIFETSPIRNYASVQVISTDALEGDYDTDEASSGWVGETAGRPETATPQTDVWRIPVHEQYAMPKATQKLLDDASVDMEAWLARKVADKMSREENTAFVNGNGTNKPRGILTYPNVASPGDYEIGAIEQFKTGVNGGFAVAPNGGDVLIDMVYGLKTQYRANGIWFMNRGTTGEVRKLKDGDGNYLWQPSAQAGEPATLMGYGAVNFEDMPAISTGSLSMGFGDIAAAYQIVDRMGFRVLRDPYTAKPFVLFYTTKRVGGDVLDFDAIRLLDFSA